MDSYSSSSSSSIEDDNNKDDISENETESVASNELMTDEDEMEDDKSDNENKIIRSDEEDEEEEEEIDDVKDGDVKNIKEDHVVDNDDDDDDDNDDDDNDVYEDIDDEEENEDSHGEEDIIKEEPTTTKRSRKKVIRLFSSDESYKKLISKTCNIYKNTKDHSSLLFKKRYVMLAHSGPIGFSNIPMIDMESIPELPDVLPPMLKMLNVCDHEYKTVSKQTRAGDEMITIYKYCTKCGDMENEKQ